MINRSGNTAIPNSPTQITLVNTNTSACGLINNGAGIDNGSGGAVTIINATDNGSTVNFVNDVGAGPSTTWSNIFGINAHYSSAIGFGSGTGLYNGSGGSTFTNVNISSPGAQGIDMDAYTGAATTGTSLSNVIVHSPQAQCFYIKGAFTGSNLQCQNPSQAGSGLFPAVTIDVTVNGYMQNKPLIISGLDIYPSASAQGGL